MDVDLTFLIRHGEVLNPDGIVYADLDGYGLSGNGRAQAEEAARRLPPRAVVVSSPLERAFETAEIIAAETGSTVLLDEQLTEWHLADRWAGARWDSLEAEFPGELAAYLDRPWDMPFSDESLEGLAKRTATAVRDHRSAVSGPLVIVSHQDPIQAARLALTGRRLGELHVDKPGHAAIITLEGAGDSSWVERGVWTPPAGETFPPI